MATSQNLQGVFSKYFRPGNKYQNNTMFPLFLLPALNKPDDELANSS